MPPKGREGVSSFARRYPRNTTTSRSIIFSRVCAIIHSFCVLQTTGLALVSPQARPRQFDRPSLGTTKEAADTVTRAYSTSIAGCLSVVRIEATRCRLTICSMVDRSTTRGGNESRGQPPSSLSPDETKPGARQSKGITSKHSERNNSVILEVRKEDHNAPIDWLLSRRLPIRSRRFYRRALEGGSVKVDGRMVKRFVRVSRGSTISVDNVVAAAAGPRDRASVPATLRSYLYPERLPELRVLYEDPYCAVVAKPAGMVCQPCEAASSGTVLHGLLHHMVHRNQVEEEDLAAARSLSQGIVQRLDKATSGVMVVAKSLKAASKFSRMFDDGNTRQQYVAICHGDPGFDSVVDASLYRRSSGKTGAVARSQAAEFGAKDAKTRVRNVATAGGLSLCLANVTNGSMHQVRVHLQWKRCPVLGDKDYGDSEANQRVSRRGSFRVDPGRPLVHSMSLEFTHPFTDKRMSFRAPMPSDMWNPAGVILRASGTPEQRREFAELQEAEQRWDVDELQEMQRKPSPVGGRGATRYFSKEGERKGGRGSKSSREAHAAIIAAGTQ